MGNFNNDRGMSGGRNFVKRDFGGRSGDRQMFKAVCSNCGKPCEVPFHPTSGKPVYCRECFGKMKGVRSDSPRPDFPRPERFEFKAPVVFDQNRNQLDSINAKLDRILKMLEPKVAVVAPVEAFKVAKVGEVVVEAKTPKVKKATKKSTSVKKE